MIAAFAGLPPTSEGVGKGLQGMLRGSAATPPPNKPLQRTQSPQQNWSNINEPLMRRPRR